MAVVYQHRRLDTNEVFYIGIGSKRDRAYSREERNYYWHNIVNKIGYDVDVLLEGLSWEDACIVEVGMIKDYGRKDLGLGNLVNMTDGGDGIINHSPDALIRIGKHSSVRNSGEGNPMYGKTHKKEARDKISKARTGTKLSKETLEKMSIALSKENHPFWGKKGKYSPNPKKIAKLDKDTLEEIEIYDTILEASEKNKVDNSAISKVALGKSKTAGGYKWKYVK